MKKETKKEMMGKKQRYKLIIESFISSIIWTIILYLCMTKYNHFIIELLNSIKEQNLAFEMILLLFPIIFLMLKISNNFLTNNEKKG